MITNSKHERHRPLRPIGGMGLRVFFVFVFWGGDDFLFEVGGTHPKNSYKKTF